MALVTLMGAAAPAGAVPPGITAVAQQDRHAAVSLEATRADFVTVYVASRPDRASDGSFLQENVVATRVLTNAEIAAGQWSDSSQLDPGSYFVMLRASADYASCVSIDPSTFASVKDPACADGHSTIVPLEIPQPETAYSVETNVLRNLGLAYLTLTGDPLGIKVPYQVCWKQPKGKKKTLKKRCANSTLDGFSWSSKASDLLSVKTKGMTRRTKFTWSSRGADSKVLLVKTIRVS